MSDKKCGHCTLCCILLEVKELQKPRNLPCQHLCKVGAGCSLHDVKPDPRPPVCNDFKCVWLVNENITSKYRPDRCGIILVESPQKTAENSWPTLEAYCRSEKDFFSDIGQSMIFQLRKQNFIVYAFMPNGRCEILQPLGRAKPQALQSTG